MESLADGLVLQGLLVALTYRQAENTGTGHFASLLGMTPLLAKSCRRLGEQ